MKLELGKEYRIRGGEKARTMFSVESPENTFSYVGGYITLADGKQRICSWNWEGLFSPFEGTLDLLEEWTEPKFEITEPGEYVCRGGDPAYVFAVLPSHFGYPIRGFCQRLDDDTGEIDTWKRDGTYDGNEKGESCLDIVSRK